MTILFRVKASKKDFDDIPEKDLPKIELTYTLKSQDLEGLAKRFPKANLFDLAQKKNHVEFQNSIARPMLAKKESQSNIQAKFDIWNGYIEKKKTFKNPEEKKIRDLQNLINNPLIPEQLKTELATELSKMK